MAKTEWFTVVGYYADNNQPFIYHQKTETAEAAAAVTIARAEGDPVIVEVLAGAHEGILDTITTLDRGWYEARAGSQCDNCEAKWRDEDLRVIERYRERVDPGGEVPSGECPDEECGALCYPIKKEAVDEQGE